MALGTGDGAGAGANLLSLTGDDPGDNDDGNWGRITDGCRANAAKAASDDNNGETT